MPQPVKRVDELSIAKQELLRRLLDRQRSIAQVVHPASNETSTGRPVPLQLPYSTDARESKAACRRFYDGVTDQLDASPFGAFSFFLNYGYVTNLNPQVARVELPERMLNRNSVRLVLEVLEDCVQPESRVLDVGCGRGGTTAVISQYFQAARITGLDLSPAAIAFCTRTHRQPGVDFVQGDSEQLPFAAGDFDIVTNIESSSCYPDLLKFYSEVSRVLVPGGRFLYADCLPVERFREAAELLDRLGFVVERERDITTNVIASCDQIAKSRVGAYGAGNDGGVLNDFLGAPGSHFYEEMRARRWTYRIYKLRRDETRARVAPG